ncbi:MAG TPA: M48 family metalloprotease [Thermomicrobiaceae bacterium]|nr:M48 family metalloprotease [Thermomicrobiaceae bacterium]
MPDETGAPHAAPRPWGTLPGPVDRVSFFDEQRRRRRSTWRLTAICSVVVLALGLAVSIVVVPLLMIESMLLLHLLDLVLPLPHAIYWPVDAYGEVLQHAGDVGQTQLRTALSVAGLAAPGIVFLFALWWWLRRLFRRAGIGGVLLTLGAREPRADDLEEHQLVNVVEEMALAGGIGRPHVMLLDAGPANAAAIGVGPDDPTIVVARALLDELDRDATQGVLAYLIGGIGNGDLGVELTIMSIFQTFGLSQMLINLPVSPTARATIRRLIRLSFRRAGAGASGEADLVNTLLAGSFVSTMDELNAFMERAGDKSRSLFVRFPTWIAIGIFFPLMLASIFGGLLIWLVEFFLLGPLLALIWRSRCYLADATAVQLTRNPDSVARGLRMLEQDGGVLPAWGPVSHLFVVGVEAGHGRRRRRTAAQIMALARIRQEQRQGVGAGRPSAEQLQQTMAALIAAGQQDEAEEKEDTRDTFEEKQGLIVPLHPSIDRRIKRLVKMGAGASAGDADPRLRFG